MAGVNIFDEPIGLLKIGTIVGYDTEKKTIQVQLSSSSALRGKSPQPLNIPLTHSMFYNNGLFIGTLPAIGTPVIVSQGSAGKNFLQSCLPDNLDYVPELTLGELLIRSNDNTKITLNLDNNINIGGKSNKFHINTEQNLSTNNLKSQNSFSDAVRKVNGIIKRDLKPNTSFDSNTKLENDDYETKMFTIGLDPTVSANSLISGAFKNPAFVESREIVYEFQPSSEVSDDLYESSLYNNTKSAAKSFIFPNRRNSRADTLSLTLAAPNYLMETVKGTVVDIFGNILDLNRSALPIGQDQNTLKPASKDKSKSFQLIKELERKSLAYHFELNARKDLAGKKVLTDINSNKDYARSRARLFVDIDKEGQFKMNIPASSEKGNISLLTRYENFSTLSTEDSNNPNKLIFRDDGIDIFQDSFAAPTFNITTGLFNKDKGSIKLSNNGADSAPQDRITESHIKHGTAYHDVLATCYTHQISDFIKFVADPSNPVFSKTAILTIPKISNVVTDTIITGGVKANAGGRSGSINFDGSIDLNIGANTVDRQSLWLDTAGGIVANIGRDIKNMSGAISMNGDLYMQIGGMGVSTDSRFEKYDNGHIGAVLDIRIFNKGLRCTMIRVDEDGVKILTPGNLSIHASQNMRITSDADIEIEAETLKLQGRMVLKEFGGSI